MRLLTPAMPLTMHDGVRWCTLFLTILLSRILAKLDHPQKVNFVFTVPSAWKNNPSVLQTFRQCVNAGHALGHQVRIGLTEPKAAAVYHVEKHPDEFNLDGLLLSCDIGGGTTDVATLVISAGFSLDELDTVEGISVGSCSIDMALYKYLTDKGLSLSVGMWDSILTEFSTIKEDFKGGASTSFYVDCGKRITLT